MTIHIVHEIVRDPTGTSIGIRLEGAGAPLGAVDVQEIREALRQHGLIVLRGFAGDPAAVRGLSEQFGGRFMVHQGVTTGQRSVADPDGTTASVDAGERPISWHRERSYAPMAPDLLLFHAVEVAATAGPTLFCDGTTLLTELAPSDRRFVEDARLEWTATAGAEEAMRALGVSAREHVGAALAAMRAALPAGESVTWQDRGNDLIITYEAPCVQPTRWTRRPAFCNFVIHHLLGEHYEGRENHASRLALRLASTAVPFPRGIAEAALHAADRLAYAHRWRPGDVVVVDNSRVMHARPTLDGARRQIHVRMAYAAF